MNYKPACKTWGKLTTIIWGQTTNILYIESQCEWLCIAGGNYNE